MEKAMQFLVYLVQVQWLFQAVKFLHYTFLEWVLLQVKSCHLFPLEKGMLPLAEPLYVCNITLQGAVTNCLTTTTPTREWSQCVPAHIGCGQTGQPHVSCWKLLLYENKHQMGAGRVKRPRTSKQLYSYCTQHGKTRKQTEGSMCIISICKVCQKILS